MNRDDLVNLIPAYVLGALDPDEHAEFESWLQSDPEAQTLLADYQAVANHLVALAPARPAPDHLQADLRRRLAASRAPVEVPAARPGSPPAPRRNIRRAWQRLTVRYGLAAAFLIVVGLVVILVQKANRSEPYNAAHMFNEITAQAGAARYPVVPGEGQDALRGELVVSTAGDHAVIRVEQLPVLDTGQTFQLWLLDTEGTLHSGGLFQREGPDQPTYIMIPMDKPISAYQRFGVSIEPEGGSPKPDGPTGPVVFRVPVTNS
jgi:anti-sigma-K factor RskA